MKVAKKKLKMNRENIVQDILESIPNMDSKNISKMIESYLVYDIYDRKDLIMVHFGVEHRYKEEDENDEETGLEGEEENEEVKSMELERTVEDEAGSEEE